MFTSRLVLPSAMTSTEKSACVANLPHLHKHTRALPAACCCYGVVAVLRLVLVLLLQLRILALSSLLITCKSSLLITCNEKTKEKRTSPRHKKQTKQRTSGRFFAPTTNFLVGNYGLRRAGEGWDDMPSMSSEVGEI